MLQPEYKRDMHKNYIILKENSEKSRECYGMKMVSNNRIQGVLDVELRSVDQRNEYYYEITGKQPLSVLFRKEALKEYQIRNILSEIIQTLKRGREYLLLEDSFILLPDYIYMNLDGTETGLIYFADYEESISEQLIRLIEYLMDKVDYKDKQAVYLIYGIYKISREADCTFERLLNFLNDEKELEAELERKEIEEREMELEEERLLDMEVEVESEEEKKKYPLWVWIGCGVSVVISLAVIILAVKLGIILDVTTGKLLVGKMAGVLGVVGALEAYCLLRILDEKNQIAYIDKRIDYIKPAKEARESRKNVRFTVEEQKLQKRTAEESKEPLEKIAGSMREAEQLEQSEQPEHPEYATVVLAERGERYFLAPEQADIYVPIFFPEFPFFIGSLKTKVDHVINSRNVSRFHAKFEQEGERFFLVDLNSTNGTFLNGARLAPNEKREVSLGDMVSFADVSYRFKRE